MTPGFVPDDYLRRYAPQDIFGTDNAYEVDLGCGDGSFLVQMSGHYPDRKFLGVERLLGRVRSVCSKIVRDGVDNARVLRAESAYFLEWMIEPGSISRLHYLFPDPWPKARHYKNRLIQPELMPVLYRALSANGEFLFKTDHEEYFEWVVEHMDQSGLFAKLPWEEDAFFYPKTDFQLQWESQGKSIFRARFGKQ